MTVPKIEVREKKQCEVFYRILSYKRDEWKFQESESHKVKKLEPFYDKIANSGLDEKIRACTDLIAPLRNGVDHAWAGSNSPKNEIEQEGEKLFGMLKEIFEELKSKAKIFV